MKALILFLIASTAYADEKIVFKTTAKKNSLSVLYQAKSKDKEFKTGLSYKRRIIDNKISIQLIYLPDTSMVYGVGVDW